LRQDVMLNPRGAFVPEDVEPAEQPNPSQLANEDLPTLFKAAVEYRPSLANMREAIRAALIQVKFQENQLLPQVNVQAQFGITQLKGGAKCGPLFGLPLSESNCTQSSGQPGFALTAFSGGYADSLNSLFNFAFYNYAGILSFEQPLENASARAALAQQRAAYEQLRMTYRAALSQVVVELENAVANFNAFIQSVRATEAATRYARESLHDEQETFKVGMATTHDLLQFQSELTSAEGNQVQAEVGLENARLALRHADGTLLASFGIRFQVQNPRETPWFARF
jgi:outer membrane protein TolC